MCLKMLLVVGVILGLSACGARRDGEASTEANNSSFNGLAGVVCAWDFSQNLPLKSKKGQPYTLMLANDKIRISELDGEMCLNIEEGGYAVIPRTKCPELNFCGQKSSFTILARINRKDKPYKQCETIAGMWNETGKKRQYCLFLNLMIKESADQVCGHVSYVGGPTPGEKWAMDASIGQTPVEFDQWTTIAFTFNGQEARSYFNGKLDHRDGLNPYAFPHELYDAGESGADFTVAAVDRLGEMGNFFVGGISHLAVYDRALSEKEISAFSF